MKKQKIPYLNFDLHRINFIIHVWVIDKTIFLGFFMEVTSFFKRIINVQKYIARFQNFKKLVNVIYGACNTILCFRMYRLSGLSFQIEAPGAI